MLDSLTKPLGCDILKLTDYAEVFFMKKIILPILILTLLISISGCGSDPSDKDISSKGKPSDSQSQKAGEGSEEKDEKAVSGFGLNTYYLDLLGERKEDIDALLGLGQYSPEFGMTDYKNGVMIGWNSLGDTPDSDSEAVSIYVSLENLFHNCPESLSAKEIAGLFPDSYTEYSPMDDENVLCVNYEGKSLLFYPDSGLRADSYAFMNSTTPYALPSGEYYEGEITEEDIKGEASYYEFALAHDEEFRGINKDWRDDREYYYLADVDQDSKDELIVKIGCGIAIYKSTGSGVREVFKDTLPDSSGSVNYWVATFEGVDYIAYASASSSGYLTLNKLSGSKLSKVRESQTIDGEYFIDGEKVFESQYEKYLDSITYPAGTDAKGLK